MFQKFSDVLPKVLTNVIRRQSSSYSSFSDDDWRYILRQRRFHHLLTREDCKQMGLPIPATHRFIRRR